MSVYQSVDESMSKSTPSPGAEVMFTDVGNNPSWHMKYAQDATQIRQKWEYPDISGHHYHLSLVYTGLN